DGIVSGMRIQLRSVLLTTGTTIAGLLPLLIQLSERNEGKDIWENLALSSIGGLTSSTVLLIGALPALYWVSVRAGWVLNARRHRMRARRGAAPAVAVDPAGS
ncbi:MAG: efflux RND transporter permease subunit, partial [Candidatus Eisenbacteria bacterium]